jgi:hypothetical protein
MKRDFIIRIDYGGLGDHLFYSHLPRIAKQHGGYDRVFISNLSKFRSSDYRRLVWEANPYIDGFSDEGSALPDFKAVPVGRNILDHVMLLAGLDDGQRFHEPELYFKPAVIESLKNAIVFDPNFVSFVGAVEARHIEKFFAEERITPDYLLAPRDKAPTIKQYGQLLATTSFEHYCSVIVSAKRFICLTSGGATLAAALGVPVTALWGHGQKSMFHHSRLHRYVNVNRGSLASRLYDRLVCRRGL